jgi:hypothetical protein
VARRGNEVNADGMPKPTISRDPQCRARVLSSAVLGSGEGKRWIIQEDIEDGGLQWVGGRAQPSLIEETKGYVRAVHHRSILRSIYDGAPLHRVEIWRHDSNSEFHVRIFEEIAPAPHLG